MDYSQRTGASARNSCCDTPSVVAHQMPAAPFESGLAPSNFPSAPAGVGRRATTHDDDDRTHSGRGGAPIAPRT